MPSDLPNSPSAATLAASRIVRAALVVAILGGAVAVSSYWLRNKPQAQRRRPPSQAALVEFSEAKPQTVRVTIRAMGMVVPARRIQLSARVGGEVLRVTDGWTPGGRMDRGDIALELDPTDYRLAVQDRQAAVASRQAAVARSRADLEAAAVALEQAAVAEERAAALAAQRRSQTEQAASALQLEMGRQAVARSEYKLLGEDLDDAGRKLVLRTPQLQAARAALEAARALERTAEADQKAAGLSVRAARVRLTAAEADTAAAEAAAAAADTALERAQLDLARATVRVPFDAIVTAKNVDPGSQVAAGTPLATLVDASEFWVEVAVPVTDLRRIRFPDGRGPGSEVRISDEAAWGADASRRGTVAQLLSEVEPQGRLARLLVTVPDPLGRDAAAPALLLDSHVRVEIAGRDVPDVVPVPRTAFRDGGRVWVLTPQKTLDIRDAVVAWGAAETVFLSAGLEAGDRLITSSLGAPVQGMVLRTGDEPPAAGNPDGKTNGTPNGTPDGKTNGTPREAGP